MSPRESAEAPRPAGKATDRRGVATEPDAPARARPWRPTPLLVASAGLHLAGLAATLGSREWRRRVLGVLALDHAVLAAAGLWPRSAALGPNLRRLSPEAARRGEVGLTFDDGPDPDVTPRVLDMLDDHGARASFFCIGRRVERWPDLVAEIVRRGHRVENHTYSHPWQLSLYGPRKIALEIDRGQEAIGRVTGRRPRLVRTPAGLRNLLLEPLLAKRGLWLASWSRRGFDTVRRDPRTVARSLVAGLQAGEILLLHDTRGVRGDGRRPVVFDVLPEVLARLREAGLRPVPVDAPEALGQTR